MLAQLSAHDQHEQLFEQAARIELLGGRKPRLFRPPYGSFNATTFRLLHQMHMLMVLWSVDTDDYERPGVEVIEQRALEGAKPGAIILMHDAGGDRSQTIAALPTVIDEDSRARPAPRHCAAAARRRPAAGRPAAAAEPQRRLRLPRAAAARGPAAALSRRRRSRTRRAARSRARTRATAGALRRGESCARARRR